ncbi:MAG TPA: hypothetical protein VHY20_12250, partial [Pirellulales bacterium]|nr:hypothetical protein [Pirellulales bacterium]
NSVQKISATPEGVRDRYAKQPDFLLSADRRFRPVAVQFGPDGCLYIVDWYNKIISHNEVPRSHPERDKTTGRIWRIRHRATARALPPVLAELPEAQLLEHLGADNVRTAELAWQQIIDRRSTGLIPELRQIAQDRDQRAARRLGALWALEGLGAATLPLLQ